MTAEADRLDEMAQRVSASSSGGDHGSAMSHSLMFVAAKADVLPGESTGVIVVSTSPPTSGQITFASQVACRIFGYSRQQLERRNVSIIIPSPIADAQCVREEELGLAGPALFC